MAFWDNLVKKFIEPKVDSLINEIKEKDKIIRIQQDRIEKGDIPRHFSVPLGVVGIESGSQSLYRWKKVVDFKTLRELSERYDVARACINRRKRQVEKVGWSIKPVNKAEKAEKYKIQIKTLTEFFKNPGGKYGRLREFLSELVEDILVFDAGVVWKDRTIGGKILKLLTVDPETIRIRINDDGSLPEPPNFAFEQWINGQKVGKFRTDEMSYIMMNPRSNSPYGLSPLEVLILGVNAALRSQVYNLSMLTEGNIPEGFFGVPPEWTPAQIKEFQTWFDAMLAGNPKFQSKIKFVPGGKGVGYMPTKKPEEMRFLEYEKWLLLKTCALFDVPPEEIGFIEHTPRANAEVQHDIASTVGLIPILNVLKEFFDQVIQKDFGFSQLEWDWYLLDKKDELRESQIAENYIKIGAISVDEWRQQNDLQPIGLSHYIMTGSGPVLVKDLLPVKQSKKFNEVESILMELSQWERKALNDVKSGKDNFRPFSGKYIPEGMKKIIEAKLFFANNKEAVRDIFEEQINLVKQEEVMKEASNLKEEIERTLRDYEKSKKVKINN